MSYDGGVTGNCECDGRVRGFLDSFDGVMAGGSVVMLWGVTGKGRRMAGAMETEMAAKEGAICH